MPRPTVRWLASVAVAVTAATCLVAGPAQAATLRWSIEGWPHGATGWGNGLVLDAVNWGTTDGTPVQMWTRRTLDSSPTALNQRWYYDGAPSANYGPIENAYARGMCLDASAKADGAAVYLYHCTGANNQKWVFIQAPIAPDGEGRHVIRNVADPERCLDVKDFGTNPGARVQMWTCNFTENQMFNLSKART